MYTWVPIEDAIVKHCDSQCWVCHKQLPTIVTALQSRQSIHVTLPNRSQLLSQPEHEVMMLIDYQCSMSCITGPPYYAESPIKTQMCIMARTSVVTTPVWLYILYTIMLIWNQSCCLGALSQCVCAVFFACSDVHCVSTQSHMLQIAALDEKAVTSRSGIVSQTYTSLCN